MSIPYTPTQSGNSNGGAIPYVPGQKPVVPPASEKVPSRGILGQILPVGGAVLGGVLGGIGGAALGVETGPGAALTGYAGAVGGSALGGSLGEAAQQGIERLTGSRKSFAPKEIAKTGAEMGVTEAIGGPVASIAGKTLKGVGEAIYKTAIPTSAKEATLIQTYKAGTPLLKRVANAFSSGENKAPVTTAKTAFRKGLVGTEEMLGVQAKKASTNIWDHLISPQLKQSTVKVDMPTFFKEAEAKIIKENPEKSRQADLLHALEALKTDYKGVGQVPLEDLQKFKEGWAKFVPEKAYKGKPIAGAFNDVKDIVSGMSRDKIYTALGPEVKQAYFDYGNLKGIQELGQKAMTGGKMKGGFGGFWGAVKDMAVTPVATISGRTTYRVGQGVELIGKPGARTVRDVLIGTSDIGKPLNPTMTSAPQ